VSSGYIPSSHPPPPRPAPPLGVPMVREDHPLACMSTHESHLYSRRCDTGTTACISVKGRSASGAGIQGGCAQVNGSFGVTPSTSCLAVGIFLRGILALGDAPECGECSPTQTGGPCIPTFTVVATYAPSVSAPTAPPTIECYQFAHFIEGSTTDLAFPPASQWLGRTCTSFTDVNCTQTSVSVPIPTAEAYSRALPSTDCCWVLTHPTVLP
jgi:hypothetical protein